MLEVLKLAISGKDRTGFPCGTIHGCRILADGSYERYHTTPQEQPYLEPLQKAITVIPESGIVHERVSE